MQGRKEIVTLLRPRDDIPWGFRFAHIHSSYPEITRINPGSLAAQHLRIGQLIIDVNGVHTLGMTACEVANLVRHQGNRLNLLLQSLNVSSSSTSGTINPNLNNNNFHQSPSRRQQTRSIGSDLMVQERMSEQLIQPMQHNPRNSQPIQVSMNHASHMPPQYLSSSSASHQHHQQHHQSPPPMTRRQRNLSMDPDLLVQERLAEQMIQPVYSSPRNTQPSGGNFGSMNQSQIQYATKAPAQVHSMTMPNRKPTSVYASTPAAPRSVIRVQNKSIELMNYNNNNNNNNNRGYRGSPSNDLMVQSVSEKRQSENKTSRLMQLIQEDDAARKIGVIDLDNGGGGGGTEQSHTGGTFPRSSRKVNEVYDEKVRNWFEHQPIIKASSIVKDQNNGENDDDEEAAAAYVRLPVKSRIGTFESRRNQVQATPSVKSLVTTKKSRGISLQQRPSAGLESKQYSQSVSQLVTPAAAASHQQHKVVNKQQSSKPAAAAKGDDRRGSYFGEVTDSYTDF